MTAVGDRVKLLHCGDPYTLLQPGTLGTVALIDALGTVHVRWDTGSNLGLVREDGDRWEVTCRCGMWPVTEYGERCPSCPPLSSSP